MTDGQRADYLTFRKARMPPIEALRRMGCYDLIPTTQALARELGINPETA